MSKILHGMAVQTEILSRLKPRIDKLRRPPGLAVVLAGQDPASEIYVRTKIKASAELGVFSEKITPPETATTDDLVALVEKLIRREDIDGILVQMPLPKHVDTRRVLETVAADKDADGFHPINVGYLVAGQKAPRACTPAGIIELLNFYQIPMAGVQRGVWGRGHIAGSPR